jgi:hypothetical protein
LIVETEITVGCFADDPHPKIIGITNRVIPMRILDIPFSLHEEHHPQITQTGAGAAQLRPGAPQEQENPASCLLLLLLSVQSVDGF